MLATHISSFDSLSGVAVGAGEIEEETVKELEETKSKLKQVQAQLEGALNENAQLRLELQQLQGS